MPLIILPGNKYNPLVDRITDANTVHDSFYNTARVPMTVTFDDIKEYRQSGIFEEKLLAIVPPEVYLLLNTYAPEILNNKQLFRIWLKRHQAYKQKWAEEKWKI